MVEIRKTEGSCVCCNSEDNIVEILFKKPHSNNMTRIILCELCSEEMCDKLVEMNNEK